MSDLFESHVPGLIVPIDTPFTGTGYDNPDCYLTLRNAHMTLISYSDDFLFVY